MPRCPIAQLAQLAQLASAVCLAAAPAAAAGNVWIVDPALGPGATHATINAAVFAAQDGDAILVRAGDYPETVEIHGKALTLTAENGADVRVRSFEIQDLSAGQSVVLSGFRPGWESFVMEPPIVVSGCAGPVWIQDCLAHAGFTPFGGPFAAMVLNCAAVTFQRGELVAGDGQPSSGLYVLDSAVSVFDALVQGGDGHSSTSFFPTSAGNPGVWLLGSSLFAEGCEFRGGQGGSSIPSAGQPCTAASNGGPGLRLEGVAPSAVLLDTLLVGGAGGTAPDPCADGAAGPGSFVVSGSISTLAGSARSLAVAQPIREGETTAIALDGQPGDLAWILVSAAQNPHAPWFGTGVLLVAEPFTIVFAGVTDAAGHKSFPVALGVIGVTYASVFLQGVFFSPTEDFPHSSGAMALLLDAAVL